MTLREKQSVFLVNFAKLIQYAASLPGYAVTAGELLRTPEQHAYNLQHGKTRAARSLHQEKLAGDLCLFVGRVYQTNTAAYRPLGAFWVKLHPANRWGGDWDKDGDITDEPFSDGNHFEMVP